ncbi:MAG: hypothetical protein WC869_00275 [Phycisphaerae bacterium]|jgi:hypothetical protein
MSNTPNGIGSSIARLIKGTAVEVRWSPKLQITVDGMVLQNAMTVEYHPSGENGNSSDLLVVLFQGSLESPRAAQVTRTISSVVANSTGDGITATLTAPA